MRTVVSACLAGAKCRYDGTDCLSGPVRDMVESGQAVAVCPEILGGLPVPRLPAEIVGGRAVTVAGQDVTAEFERGASLAFRIACEAGCGRAVLKARSPSCGSGVIHDGSFSGRLAPRDGFFAALLKQAGITVLTEDDLPVRPETAGGTLP